MEIRDSRDLKKSIIEGSLGSVTTTVTTGVFLTGFALALGATDAVIGIIAALPALANVAQILGSYLLIKTGSAKHICTLSLLGHRLMWGVILLIPLVTPPHANRVAFLMVGLAAASLFASFVNVTWLSWISQLVPADLRGRFFAQRNMFAGAVAMIGGVIAGRFLDTWHARLPQLELHGYSILYGVGFLFGLACWMILRGIAEPPSEPGDVEGFWRNLRLPLADENFRRLITFYLGWGFAVRLVGPFFDVYMIRTLQISFATIAVLGLVSSSANVLGMRLWGPLSDRMGTKPILFIGCVTASITPLLWLFTSPSATGILWVVYALTGIGWASIGLNTSALLIKMAPARIASIYFAVFAALTGLIEAIAPGIGGYLAQYTADIQLEWSGFTLTGLPILFLLTTVLRFASLPLLLRVQVPGELEIPDPMQALKTLRRTVRLRYLRPDGMNPIERLSLRASLTADQVERHFDDYWDRRSSAWFRSNRPLRALEDKTYQRLNQAEDQVDRILQPIMRALDALERIDEPDPPSFQRRDS